MRNHFRTAAVNTALIAAVMAAPAFPAGPSAADFTMHVPLLLEAPAIDGDLSEWKELSYTDGVWDIERLRYTPWFDPRINRLTDHGDEPSPGEDLRARYYIAWDRRFLYLGAEGWDNVNDVDDPEPGRNRWWYMDAVAWYMEAPRDEAPESFSQGDNGFCFVIDPRKPDYGAWWMHGTADTTYIHEPLPKPRSITRCGSIPGGAARAISFSRRASTWRPPSASATRTGGPRRSATCTAWRSFTPIRTGAPTAGISCSTETATTTRPGARSSSWARPVRSSGNRNSPGSTGSRRRRAAMIPDAPDSRREGLRPFSASPRKTMASAETPCRSS